MNVSNNKMNEGNKLNEANKMKTDNKSDNLNNAKVEVEMGGHF